MLLSEFWDSSRSLTKKLHISSPLALAKVIEVDAPVPLVPAGEGGLELLRLAAPVHSLDDYPRLLD